MHEAWPSRAERNGPSDDGCLLLCENDKCLLLCENDKCLLLCENDKGTSADLLDVERQCKEGRVCIIAVATMQGGMQCC